LIGINSLWFVRPKEKLLRIEEKGIRLNFINDCNKENTRYHIGKVILARSFLTNLSHQFFRTNDSLLNDIIVIPLLRCNMILLSLVLPVVLLQFVFLALLRCVYIGFSFTLSFYSISLWIGFHTSSKMAIDWFCCHVNLIM